MANGQDDSQLGLYGVNFKSSMFDIKGIATIISERLTNGSTGDHDNRVIRPGLRAAHHAVSTVGACRVSWSR